MSSRHLIDPELLPLLTAFHSFDYQPGAFVAEEARRASREALRRRFQP